MPASESTPLTAEALHGFLAQARPGGYIALQAYVQPTAHTDVALAALRVRLRDKFRMATTSGYGPRFLHSTGQLHKGDAGHGLFIQLTANSPHDAPIPDTVGTVVGAVREPPAAPIPDTAATVVGAVREPPAAPIPDTTATAVGAVREPPAAPAAPASSITFGVLKMAQALGDQQALLDAGRSVIHFHLGDDVLGGLKRLLEAVG